MEIGRRLANADPRRAGAAGLLDNLPHAIFLVAGGGRVVFANSAAEALLADADAIRFVSGYLCAATKDHTARLSNAVARASGEGSGNAGDAVSLPRRAPGRALTAFVAPLAPAVDWGVLPSPSAIILVVDPGSHRQPSEGTIRLADHHRDGPPLARRELQCLLLVAAGKSSKAIAIELSLSPHTIDQYIESAMRKLDSATRAEAVAMAVALGLMAA
jgi:DNA-binding CsgD family transcriptional regulator